MWDARFDGAVARTAQRPLASGRLGMFPALVWLGLQSSAALGVLLSLNPATIALGCAVVPVVALYPAAKRVTWAPQAVLGAAMNYGVLMGWAATHGTLDVAPALALYAGGVAWTVVYDTVYAHQDAADDAKLGLKSTALWFGEASPRILAALSVVAGAAWTAAGVTAGLAWPYYLAVAASTGWLAAGSLRQRLGDRQALAASFVGNRWVGWAMLAGIVAGKAMM
jgi:4-hydroxybenzoate polyprenyl transferase